MNSKGKRGINDLTHQDCTYIWVARANGVQSRELADELNTTPGIINYVLRGHGPKVYISDATRAAAEASIVRRPGATKKALLRNRREARKERAARALAEKVAAKLDQPELPKPAIVPPSNGNGADHGAAHSRPTTLGFDGLFSLAVDLQLWAVEALAAGTVSEEELDIIERTAPLAARRIAEGAWPHINGTTERQSARLS